MNGKWPLSVGSPQSMWARGESVEDRQEQLTTIRCEKCYNTVEQSGLGAPRSEGFILPVRLMDVTQGR